MQPRFATESDTPEVIRLAGMMYESMGLDSRDPAWLSRADERFRECLGRDVQAVVVDDPDPSSGRLIASGAVVVAERLPTPHNPGGRVGYIQWIATEPHARRRGLATMLMRMLLDWCSEQDVPIVELHATPDGEPLYRSLGFGQEGGTAMRCRTRDPGSPEARAPNPVARRRQEYED